MSADDPLAHPRGYPLGDVRLQVGNTRHGDNALRPVIGSSQPPAGRSTARASRDAQALRIDFLARFQVIQGDS